MKILAICGSLRKSSVNRAALHAFGEAVAEKADYSIAELTGIPLFNQDEEALGLPNEVVALADQIIEADAIVIGTPEYNYSIPGVLKNTLDWLSRHPKKPLAAKPCLIIGASPGNVGTARAQYHLRQIGVSLDIRFINKPEVMIGGSMQKFTDGKLNDDATKEHLAKAANALIAFTAG